MLLSKKAFVLLNKRSIFLYGSGGLLRDQNDDLLLGSSIGFSSNETILFLHKENTHSK